jgi:hypothetical protein
MAESSSSSADNNKLAVSLSSQPANNLLSKRCIRNKAGGFLQPPSSPTLLALILQLHDSTRHPAHCRQEKNYAPVCMAQQLRPKSDSTEYIRTFSLLSCREDCHQMHA